MRVIALFILLCRVLLSTSWQSQSQNQNRNGRDRNPEPILNSNELNGHPAFLVNYDIEKGSEVKRFMVDSASAKLPVSSSEHIADDNVFASRSEKKFLKDHISDIAGSSATVSVAEDYNPISDGTPVGLPISGTIVTEPEPFVEEVKVPIDVTSTINLELLDTSSLMNQENLKSFLEITEGFLSFHLFKGSFMHSLLEKEGLQLIMIYQSRYIDGGFQVQQIRNVVSPLYVRIQVSGYFDEESGVGSDYVFNGDFGKALESIFVQKAMEYVEALKFADSKYFSPLNKVKLVQIKETKSNEIGDSATEEDERSDDTLSEGNIPTLTMPPPPKYSNTKIIQEPKSTDEIREKNMGLLSQNAVIGVAISVVVLLMLVVVFIAYYFFIRKSKTDSSIYKEEEDDNFEHPGQKLCASHDNNSRNRRSELNSTIDSVAEENFPRKQALSFKTSHDTNNDDIECQAMYSYNQSLGSMGSINTNGSIFKELSTHSHMSYDKELSTHSHMSYYDKELSTHSHMSYAYSLDPGIEASVLDGMMADFSNKVNSDTMPIREIPLVGMSTKEETRVLSTQNREKSIAYDHFGNTNIEIAPSDLKLTKSELQMLPSNLRSSDDEDDWDEKVDDDFQQCQIDSKAITLKISAPTGKLGIVIDTSREGPIVHRVKKESQLSNKIFPGDIIISIDEVDTRAMSVSEVSDLMVKTAKQNRTLVVRRTPETH